MVFMAIDHFILYRIGTTISTFNFLSSCWVVRINYLEFSGGSVTSHSQLI